MAKRGPYKKRKGKVPLQSVRIDPKTVILVDASFDPEEAKAHFLKRVEQSKPGGPRSLQIKTKKS